MRALVATLVVATAVFAAPSPVGADKGESITFRVEQGFSVSKTYPPMPVNDAGSSFTDPADCIDLPWCTLIQIDFKFPAGFNPDKDEYVVPTAVYWDDKPVVEGTAQGNDLDIYVYTKETTKDSAGKEKVTYREVGRSASARQPETMKLFGPMPDNPTLYMVVYNFLGPNLGYKVEMKFKGVSVEELPEYGSPGFGGGEDDSSSASTGAGSSESDFSSAPFKPFGDDFVPSTPSGLPTSAGSISGGPSLGVPISGSDDFGNFGGSGDFDRELAGGGTQSGVDLLAASRREAGPPKPVPGAVLFFWLGVVPAVLGGVAIGALIRRRPAALTLAVPAGAAARPAAA